MRTSRISRDAAKVFERVAAGSASPPRRTTRSLTRFAYAAAATAASTAKDEKSSRIIPDIEDSITGSAPPAKRRRKRSPSADPFAKRVKAEPVDDDDKDAALSAISSPPPPPPPSKARRAPRKPARKVVADPSTGETTAVAPPSDWEDMYDAVRAMRAPGGAAHGAAVDTMGCERLADRSASPRDQRFHTLIALMLSSQTKDTVNAVVMRRLQAELPACGPGAPVGLNLENVLAVDPKVLNEFIWAVGFHNNKTKYIKQAAEILRDRWNGDIPDTIQGLTSLPGVGPKMAYLCLSVAWNRTEGIGVDVHVHRITNLWGWNRTKTPEETRAALQAWLPRDRWREINSLLVGLGQSVCLPVGRRCGECELGLRGLCKAADRKKVAEGRRVKGELLKEEVGMFKKEDEEEEVKEEVVKEEVVKEEVVKEEVVKEEDKDKVLSETPIALPEAKEDPAAPNSVADHRQPAGRRRTRATTTAT